jgi:small subunit ribosomal protein S9
MEGSGRITVNRRRMTDYFPAMARRLDVLRPFEVTNTLGAFNVMSTVRGGGSTGAGCLLAVHGGTSFTSARAAR